MFAKLLPSIISLIGGAVDKVITNKDEAEKIKAEITLAAMNQNSAELEGAVDVIKTEAQGNWLQRTWRPMMMIWFAGLIGAHWLGYTPENLDKDHVQKLLEIVQVGIGGYILGRSGEKIMKEYKRKE